MTRKEQNTILDDKIESNINQYTVDRLNAKISAFSSDNLNKYEFLTRKDLKYKPNALDKARFEFSPLGQTFSMGLDKTAQGYQEEGIIKLLKDIRDGLGPRALGGPGGPDLDRPDDDTGNDNDNDNDNDNGNDNGNDMPNLETEKEVAKTNMVNEFNEFNNEIKNFHEMARNKLNNDIKRLNKLNNNFKNIKNHVEEINDKIINKEKELDHVKNEYNNLFFKLNQSNQELNIIRNELHKTKKK